MFSEEFEKQKNLLNLIISNLEITMKEIKSFKTEMNDLIRTAQNSLRRCQRKKFKSVRKKLNTLINEFVKYMDGSWILNMSITNQQHQKIAPGGRTSGLMGLRKKTEKVGKIGKLKQKNVSGRNQTLMKNLSQKEPIEKNPKKQQKNQPRTIICRLLNYNDKENILKN